MWYFSWILGTALALTFGVLNAIWYEVMDEAASRRDGGGSPPRDADTSPPGDGSG
jgi:cytochrome bd-I ubiquinol oxidase subunit X